MAGHSKWANIKHRKGAKDAKKGAAFAKYSREITKAAKLGGPDPAGNFRLRTAIDKAKTSGIPNDNIQRAIEKGAGTGGSDNLEDMTYEGYGPGGVAVFIEAMTDNRNRTAGDIRSYFNKFEGNLGADGCVAWIFEQRGQITISDKKINEETLFDKVAEAGAEDMHHNAEENVFEIFTDPLALNDVCQSLTTQGVAIATAAVTRIPQNSVTVSDPAQAKMLLRLLDVIEAQDDVQAVYANFEMDDALLEAFEKQSV